MADAVGALKALGQVSLHTSGKAKSQTTARGREGTGNWGCTCIHTKSGGKGCTRVRAGEHQPGGRPPLTLPKAGTPV